MTNFVFQKIDECSDALLLQMEKIENLAQIHPWTSNDLSKCVGSRYYSVGVFQNETLYGYAIYDYVLDECTLQNICIAPVVQGKKLGSALLKKSLEMITQDFGIKNVFLEVRVSNIKAINLYVSFGFTEDGYRKGYYTSATGVCEDALLMSLHY